MIGRVKKILRGPGTVTLDVTVPGGTSHSIKPQFLGALGVAYRLFCGRLTKLVKAPIPVLLQRVDLPIERLDSFEHVREFANVYLYHGLWRATLSGFGLANRTDFYLGHIYLLTRARHFVPCARLGGMTW